MRRYNLEMLGIRETHWTQAGQQRLPSGELLRNKRAAINTSRKRAEKAKAQAEYAQENKQMKRSIRTDNRKYVEDPAMTAEYAARKGNMRQLCDTTKKLSGNYRKPKRLVKSKEDKLIPNIKEQSSSYAKDVALHDENQDSPDTMKPLFLLTTTATITGGALDFRIM
ncbi:unnamed protein product [Schistosoma margrebowiei]|uniref:Uncharacterized protein n=1 Tax=Schistosoma margrebowiei TaxID=48269 RepID=A0A183LJQ9_9TREM|nr:unnamed protein product [Schistosoma margrebowiei]